jgi:hypothetical protein
MRTLSATLTALSLAACAAQPLTLTDIGAHIRSDFGAGKPSCAGRSPAGPGQSHLAQADCFAANPVAQPKPRVQTAQAHATQRVVNVHPAAFNTFGQAPAPKLDGAGAEGVPALNSEASCHPADNLAVEESMNRCRGDESSARDQLARRWTEFPSADRAHCMRYTSLGGGGTYTDLLTCLEMEQYARNLNIKSRSAVNQ